MSILQKNGFGDLHIIDPSDDAGIAADCQVVKDVFPGSLANSGEVFDVIIAQHFLEHSADPVSVLKEMRKLLTEHGTIYVEAPDIAASAIEDRSEWLSIVYALHSSYFDGGTLSLAANQAGLSVVEIHQVEHYGKSILGVFAKNLSPTNQPVCNTDNGGVVQAINHYFDELMKFGRILPQGLPCWGGGLRDA